MKRSAILVLAGVLVCAITVFAQIGQTKRAGDERVKRLLDKAELKYEVDSDGDFRLVNKFDNDRTHILFVNSNTENYLNMEIREVWAVGYIPPQGEIGGEIALDLLRENRKKKLGAWQIMRVGGKDVAAFVAQIAADTDEKTLMGVMHLVSKTADDLEARLLHNDEL
jgi:hypothetical protein